MYISNIQFTNNYNKVRRNNYKNENNVSCPLLSEKTINKAGKNVTFGNSYSESLNAYQIIMTIPKMQSIKKLFNTKQIQLGLKETIDFNNKFGPKLIDSILLHDCYNKFINNAAEKAGELCYNNPNASDTREIIEQFLTSTFLCKPFDGQDLIPLRAKDLFINLDNSYSEFKINLVTNALNKGIKLNQLEILLEGIEPGNFKNQLENINNYKLRYYTEEIKADSPFDNTPDSRS